MNVPAKTPSAAAIAAQSELHQLRLNAIVGGHELPTVEGEARVIDKHWFDHRCEMQRVLELELHGANERMAKESALLDFLFTPPGRNWLYDQEFKQTHWNLRPALSAKIAEYSERSEAAQ